MAKRMIATTIAFTLFTIHLGATLLYLAPRNPLMTLYQVAVDRYMNPVFTQSWLLFAPEPATSALQLWYHCQSDNGRWTGWKDPTARLLREHQEWRISYRGKLLQMYENIPRSLVNTNAELSKGQASCSANKAARPCPHIEANIRKTPAYQVALRFVTDLCHRDVTIRNSLKAIEFQAVLVGAPQFSDIFDAGEKKNSSFGRIKILRFSPVNVEGASHAVASF